MSDQLRLNGHTPLMPALRKQRQKDLCEFPDLQNEFQEKSRLHRAALSQTKE